MNGGELGGGLTNNYNVWLDGQLVKMTRGVGDWSYELYSLDHRIYWYFFVGKSLFARNVFLAFLQRATKFSNAIHAFRSAALRSQARYR